MSKLSKFRSAPRAFFADSRSPFVRALGRGLQPVLSRRKVLDFLLEPLETIASAPLLGSLAARRLDRARRRRVDYLRAAGNPTVSIVVAAFNAEETIAATIDSLLAQTYEHLEIIVVDDGSTDATLEIVGEFSDERIVVRQSEMNRGAAGARNLGLKAASGDFVTFNDADDRSHAERVERQLAAVLSEADAVMSVCGSQREDRAGRPVTINGVTTKKAVITMLFRRVPVLARVGFLRDLAVSEDAEYYERIRVAFGDDAEVVLPTRLYFARYRPGSLLFSDGVVEVTGDRSIRHRRSAEADAEWQRILERIERIRAGEENAYVDFSA